MTEKRLYKIEFKEVGNSGIFVSQSRTGVEGSMNILKESGLTPFAYEEAVRELDSNTEFKNMMKGRMFYLKGIEAPEVERNMLDNGNIYPGEDIDAEKTIFIHNCRQPVAIYVRRDIEAKDDRRYDLWVGGDPNIAASVIVGYKTSCRIPGEMELDDGRIDELPNHTTEMERNTLDEFPPYGADPGSMLRDDD